MIPLLQHRHITYNNIASPRHAIKITYTTYNTIAFTTTYNAISNNTHGYLLTLHIITYTTYKCDSYTPLN